MTVINGQTIREAGVGSWIAPVCSSETPSPTSAYTRGACPSLSTPMMTGDGLLVRLRPATAGLTLSQMRLLAEAAARRGNGIIEITARGNLQLRGLKAQTVQALSEDIDRARIIPETGVAIETGPLSGIDPQEIADARDMAAALRKAIVALEAPLVVAPKLAIIIDGGGLLGLDAVSADIRLKAVRSSAGMPDWIIAIGGTGRSARFLGTISCARVVPAVLDLLKVLASRGPRARGRQLDATAIGHLFSRAGGPPTYSKREQSPVGLHRLAAGRVALGLRLSFGQIRAADLIAFADLVGSYGAKEVRMAAGHAMLLLGLTEDAAKAAKLAAANFGLCADPADPASHIATCAGAGACASGFYETKAAATELLNAGREFLDGSIRVHFSGCPKGCAHPSPAALTVVGTPTGYGLVVNGVASAAPLAYIGTNDLPSALRGIARLVHDKKEAGESANRCLKRLTADDIVTALQQG
ncbi:precorrin-3B synthase [Rhizobium tubonense]|uniref:Precorrin-3B synthase n=1 Tax=Rhizobium tubonense TaxID=484088 RepID=A0A2W4DJW4_9HYPH|nr:precorrin-3B synthase [Rhizobium tubonense]PZM16474.1 precorrin-3B synthase [Rhizobium tubonense]